MVPSDSTHALPLSHVVKVRLELGGSEDPNIKLDNLSSLVEELGLKFSISKGHSLKLSN